MGIQRWEFITPEGVKGGTGKPMSWMFCDNPGDSAAAPTSGRTPYSSWQGGSHTDASQWARMGKMDEVAPSDVLLFKFEEEAENILSAMFTVVNDVAGACPNVPAYLSGRPNSMRRRQRDHSDRAPVGIVVDTTISGGIGRDTIQKRGAAILALTRMLSQRRAVELWVGTGLNKGRGAGFCFTKIDTAPLDLARAAYMLCHVSATMCLGYGALFAIGCGGSWPYSGESMKAPDFKKVCQTAMPHLTDFVALPGLIIYDECVRDPIKWISERLREHGDLGDE